MNYFNELRQHHGMTAAELAGVLGVSRGSLSVMLCGAVVISPRVWNQLVKKRVFTDDELILLRSEIIARKMSKYRPL